MKDSTQMIFVCDNPYINMNCSVQWSSGKNDDIYNKFIYAGSMQVGKCSFKRCILKKDHFLRYKKKKENLEIW